MSDARQKASSIDSRRTRGLQTLLQYQRESFVRKVDGVGERDARDPLVASCTTILWLTKHMARAEQLWIVERFAGNRPDVLDDTVQPGDTIGSAIATYRQTWPLVNNIVDAAPSLDALCHDVGTEAPVNLRWVLMHLLEETARHAGHVDILRTHRRKHWSLTYISADRALAVGGARSGKCDGFDRRS